MYVPGTGVVISGGVYLRLIGNIFALAGAVNNELLKGNIPLPFVVVHSGKTATTLSGFWRNIVLSSTKFALDEGSFCGYWKARKIDCKSEIRWTRRVDGYDAVKIGSKIAARYRESIGDV